MEDIITSRALIAQLVEREAFNLVAVGGFNSCLVTFHLQDSPSQNS